MSDLARTQKKLVGAPGRTIGELIDRDADLTRAITCYQGYIKALQVEIEVLMAQRTMVRRRLKTEL